METIQETFGERHGEHTIGELRHENHLISSELLQKYLTYSSRHRQQRRRRPLSAELYRILGHASGHHGLGGNEQH